MNYQKQIIKFFIGFVTIIIIWFLPSTLYGSQDSIKTKKFNCSISLGLHNGWFPDNIWKPDKVTVSDPTASWDSFADSIKLNSKLSWEIYCRYRFSFNSRFSAEIGLGVNSLKYHRVYFYQDSLINQNDYLPKEKMLSTLNISLPLRCNYRVKQMIFSSGINFIPLRYEMRQNDVHNGQHYESTKLIFDYSKIIPFVSISIILDSDPIQLQPELGLNYRPNIYGNLWGIFFSVNIRI